MYRTTLKIVYEAKPGTPQTHFPGLATILTDFGRPIAVADTPNAGDDEVHQFSTIAINGHIWAVQAESMINGSVGALVQTMRPIPAGTASDPLVLLQDTIAEFAAQQDWSEVEWSAPQPATLIIDDIPYEASDLYCRGYRCIAARFHDLIIVAIVAHDEGAELRLITIDETMLPITEVPE